jgi:hypothetical protein
MANMSLVKKEAQTKPNIMEKDTQNIAALALDIMGLVQPNIPKQVILMWPASCGKFGHMLLSEYMTVYGWVWLSTNNAFTPKPA